MFYGNIYQLVVGPVRTPSDGKQLLLEDFEVLLSVTLDPQQL